MQKVQLIASAKLNLCLEVIKRCDNGFHEIRSIMLKSKYLFDEIDVVFDENKPGIEIACTHLGVPTDEKNICYKIAEKFFTKINQKIGLQLRITKRIPPLTGLGGGSSDGASVLCALNAYFHNPLTFNELIVLAASVGKDIPFFLQPEICAKISGAGEKVESIPTFPELYLLIINPGGEISTPWAYAQLDKNLWFMHNQNRKNLTKMLKNSAITHQDITPYLHNDFTIVAEKSYPIIREIQTALKAFGAQATSISGKGPTTFGVFENIIELERVQKIMQKHYPTFFISRY